MMKRWVVVYCIALATAAMPGLLRAGPTPLPDDPVCTAEDRMFMARAFEAAKQAVERGSRPLARCW